MPVSVVIPTYNGLPLLKKHLSHVFDALRRHDEVVIVDDAGTDETVVYLTKTYGLTSVKTDEEGIFCFKGTYHDVDVKLVASERNLQFAGACNLGVRQSKSEIILLLNNDVRPEKDILQYLLPHFKDLKVFAVGCKEHAASENNKEYGRSEAHFERGFYIHNRAQRQISGPTAWVSGGSGAFRKTMWVKLKGFDENFKPAYGEDIDLSFRAQMRGWKTLFEERAVVHHVHESTNRSVFGMHRIEVMSFKNDFLFMWKNAKGKELWAHFLWLPYHLVLTNIRSRGRFGRGFIAALASLLRAN